MSTRSRGVVAVSLLATLGVATACGQSDPAPAGDSRSSSASVSASPSTGATAADPPTEGSTSRAGWGPTPEEIAQAEAMVAEWTPEQLAGQVIVGRFAGTDPEIPAQMVRDLHLAGVCITSSSIVDRDQVTAMTAAVSEAVVDDGRDFPAVIGVDQEGGVVSHLDGVATTFPPFADAGEAIAGDPQDGERLVYQAADAAGLELRDLGFTWVFAPVADVTIGSGDPTIGSRSASEDPRIAAQAIGAAVRGYKQSGVVSTVKHFPGHGSVTADSHDTLPEQSESLGTLRDRDLVPFRKALNVRAPAVMMAHLDVKALAPGVPSSLAPEVYDYLRNRLHFQGVAITDSLGMGAVSGTDRPAVTALKAGADLLLMPADTAGAHATVMKAIADGEVPRSRAEEAAARVVALQLWQQRIAGETPVPDDVSTEAEAASAALSAAGS